MNGLTPIETVYKGYRFRSRLEARWAVFFDELGIEYQYETEGIVLPEIGYYLPDFWLPAYKIWVEIKPTAPTTFDLACQKCHGLACASRTEVLMICGTPGFETNSDPSYEIRVFGGEQWMIFEPNDMLEDHLPAGAYFRILQRSCADMLAKDRVLHKSDLETIYPLPPFPSEQDLRRHISGLWAIYRKRALELDGVYPPRRLAVGHWQRRENTTVTPTSTFVSFEKTLGKYMTHHEVVRALTAGRQARFEHLS